MTESLQERIRRLHSRLIDCLDGGFEDEEACREAEELLQPDYDYDLRHFSYDELAGGLQKAYMDLQGAEKA